jgi:hypothetical protein
MFPTDRAALETALARALDVAVEFVTLGEYRFAPLPDDEHGTSPASEGPVPATRQALSSVGVTCPRLPAPATALGRIRIEAEMMATEAAALPACRSEGRRGLPRPPRPHGRTRAGTAAPEPQLCLYPG